MANSWDNTDPKWKLTWKWPGAQRVRDRVFLWFSLKDKLLTDKESQETYVPRAQMILVLYADKELKIYGTSDVIVL